MTIEQGMGRLHTTPEIKRRNEKVFKIFSESDTNAVNGDLYRVRVGGSRG